MLAWADQSESVALTQALAGHHVIKSIAHNFLSHELIRYKFDGNNPYGLNIEIIDDAMIALPFFWA